MRKELSTSERQRRVPRFGVVLLAGMGLVVVGCGEGEAVIETSDVPRTSVTAETLSSATDPTGPATPITTSAALPQATDVTATATTASLGTWRMIAASPLGARSNPVSAWTGAELLVWAGLRETSDSCGMDVGGGLLCGEPAVFDGAAYDPATDTWRTIADGPLPAGGAPTQVIPQGAWTGSELVVWGGWGDPIAAAYDPAADRWRDLPPGPLETRDQQAVVAWGGRVAMLGGRTHWGLGPGPSEPRLDGAMLDPATGEWAALPDLPPNDEPMASGLVAAAEANGGLFVVSLVNPHGYVLDSVGAEWRSVGSAGVAGYFDPVGIAGGRWLFVGGESGRAIALDLTSGQWHEAAASAGATIVGYAGAGTGDRLLAIAERFVTDTGPPRPALSWDPDTDVWTELAPPPLEDRVSPAVAWTGAELVVWGGGSTGGLGGPVLADGAALTP